MEQNVIELVGKDANFLLQWGEGKVVIKSSSKTIALDVHGLDRLITALVQARGQMRKRERATLYARVPHHLKSQFLLKAQAQGLTQNAAIIAAVQKYMGGENNDLARP